MCMVTDLAMSVVNNQPTAGYICSMIYFIRPTGSDHRHVSFPEVSNLLKAVPVCLCGN